MIATQRFAGLRPVTCRLLGAFAFAVAAGTSLPVMMPAPAHAAVSAVAQRIADHFSSVKTMTGDFVQIGPTGQQAAGKFFMERPGRIRFNYDSSSPLKVVSNGRAVAIGNTRLNSWQVYPLSSTPLKLLLSPRIDLSGKMVKSVKEGPDLITIVLGDRSVFGDSTITMMFDPTDYGLKQWTITDAQGKNTTVMVYNVQTGVQLSSKLFQLPAAATKPMSPRQ